MFFYENINNACYFQALTGSFTYIVWFYNDNKHYLETSISQILDFFFHYPDFPFLCVLGMFLQSVSLLRMQFCSVSSLLLTVTKAYFQLAALL